MKRKQAVWTLIDEIQTATGLTGSAGGQDSVRTVGGDAEVSPPEVVLDWTATRLVNYNGANNLGGKTTDTSGDQTGWEYHRYYRMVVDCVVRSYKEVEREDLVDAIQDRLARYEYDASRFSADTTEWEVGTVSPETNPIVEPDWYQSSVPVEFTLLERVTETGDTLTTIQQTNADDMIDTTLEEGEETVN